MFSKSRLVALACVLFALSAAGAPAAAQDRRAAPEAATGWRRIGPTQAKSFMVAAANPLAVEAGLEVLREGGSAADAAITVQLVVDRWSHSPPDSVTVPSRSTRTPQEAAQGL